MQSTMVKLIAYFLLSYFVSLIAQMYLCQTKLNLVNTYKTYILWYMYDSEMFLCYLWFIRLFRFTFDKLSFCGILWIWWCWLDLQIFKIKLKLFSVFVCYYNLYWMFMSYVELDMKISKNIAVFYYMCECGVDLTKCIVVNLRIY